MLILGIIILVAAIMKWIAMWKIPQEDLVKRSEAEVA
jgi:carbon starvation protein